MLTEFQLWLLRAPIRQSMQHPTLQDPSGPRLPMVCCKTVTQMSALEVNMHMRYFLPQLLFHTSQKSRCLFPPCTCANSRYMDGRWTCPRDMQYCIRVSAGVCPYMDGLQALALLLELVLLLFQLVVAHASAPVKAGPHSLQPLAQDQRLEIGLCSQVFWGIAQSFGCYKASTHGAGCCSGSCLV